MFKDITSKTARWGDLPPRVREAVHSSRSILDDIPPEWREKMKLYYDNYNDNK